MESTQSKPEFPERPSGGCPPSEGLRLMRAFVQLPPEERLEIIALVERRLAP